MLKRVISGGQTGADVGGLKAAKESGLETGGMVPKGCLTELGARPELLTLYNLVEHESASYVPRTQANVKNSDGTIRFAANFRSPGEICTLKAIVANDKPYIDVDVKNPLPADYVAKWIKENNIEVLNVAGNRESTYPGIEAFVIKYLKEVVSHGRTLETVV